MNWEFTLNPDIPLLLKLTRDGDIPAWLAASSLPITVGIVPVSKYGSQIRLKTALDKLLDKFGLVDKQETLLWFILDQHISHYGQLEIVEASVEARELLRDISQLLLVLRDPNKFEATISLDYQKSNNRRSSVRIVNPHTLQWLGQLIERSITELEFNEQQLGMSAYNLLRNPEGKLFPEYPLSFENLIKAANAKVKSTYAKRFLARFLDTIHRVIGSQPFLVGKPNITLSSRQALFLYQLSEILGWLEASNRKTAERSNYIQALFSTYVR